MDKLKEAFRRGVITAEKYRDAVVQRSVEILQTVNFRRIIELDKGTHGSVILLQTPMGSEVAAKIVMANDVSAGETLHWSRLKHPNVLPLLAMRHLQETDAFVFLMPKLPGTLDCKVKEFRYLFDKSELSTAVGWVKDIAKGLQHLHNQGLCHLDLKCNNILISGKDEAVVSDFGYLTRTDQDVCCYGSPIMYSPPEAKFCNGVRCAVDGKSLDIWTLGLLTVEMLTGESVLKTVSRKFGEITSWDEQIYPVLFDILQRKRFTSIVEQQFPSSTRRKRVIRHLLPFLRACLNVDPTHRPTVEEILSHRAFGGNHDFEKPRFDIWSTRMSPMRLKLLISKYIFQDAKNRDKNCTDIDASRSDGGDSCERITKGQRVLQWINTKKVTMSSFLARCVSSRPFFKKR